MQTALLVRLRPAGPWRFGPDSGARDHTAVIGHSDTFFSAITWAMHRLHLREEWLAATAEAAVPAVRLSSLYPFLGRMLYVVPPRSLWPPAASPRVRWKAASLVPAGVIQDLALGKPPAEERWEIDTRSQCLIPSGGVPPFRMAIRRSAAVDRLAQGRIETHQAACIEFNHNAGIWAVALFDSEEAQELWRDRLKSALRLLADSGIGGERSSGWGQADGVEFQSGAFPALLFPEWSAASPSPGQWLLSLFNPAAADGVDWSSGHWGLEDRSRIGSKAVRMVTEGSVVSAPGTLSGRAVDVAPQGHDHPIWRAGFAVAVPLPLEMEEAAS